MRSILPSEILSGALLLLAASLLALSCGKRPVRSEIPVADAAALRVELQDAFSTANTLLADAARVVDSIATMPGGVTRDQFDLALYRQVLLECFTEDLVRVAPADGSGNALSVETHPGVGSTPLSSREAVVGFAPCMPNHLEVLEEHLGALGTEPRRQLVRRFVTVDALRVALRNDLTAAIDELGIRASLAEAEVVRLREVSQERRLRMVSDGTAPEQLLEAEREYEELVLELETADEILALVDSQLEQMGRRRRALIEAVARNIAMLGSEADVE